MNKLVPASHTRTPRERAQAVGALAPRLADGLARLELALPETTQAQLIAYLALLQKWNGVYNLTSVRDPSAMLVQHLLDSLSALRPLEQRLARRATSVAVNTAPRVADIGSGGGLPGIPLAIVHPDWQLMLVEPVGKKAAFLRQCAAELRLPNVQVRQDHVERLAPTPCDAITCRAFASLADFTGGIAPLLPATPGADPVVMAMKGVVPHDEIAALPSPWTVVEIVPVEVPDLDAERHLVFLQRDQR